MNFFIALAITIQAFSPSQRPHGLGLKHFVREHTVSSPVVRHTWEAQDDKGCVVRPLEGDVDGRTVKVCG